MGLIHNIIVTVVHLLFVAMDTLAMMTLIKIVYQRWRPSWLKQAADIVEPVMKLITGHLETYVTRITNRTYTDKTLIVIFIVCLSVLRFVIGGLFING